MRSFLLLHHIYSAHREGTSQTVTKTWHLVNMLNSCSNDRIQRSHGQCQDKVISVHYLEIADKDACVGHQDCTFSCFKLQHYITLSVNLTPLHQFYLYIIRSCKCNESVVRFYIVKVSLTAASWKLQTTIYCVRCIDNCLTKSKHNGRRRRRSVLSDSKAVEETSTCQVDVPYEHEQMEMIVR